MLELVSVRRFNNAQRTQMHLRHAGMAVAAVRMRRWRRFAVRIRDCVAVRDKTVVPWMLVLMVTDMK